MSINMQEGRFPHIYWIDLRRDGVFTECAVMKRDSHGNVYYFPVNALDSIDKRRLHKIVSNRNAPHFPLWDLMSNITLNNGVNALDYFHQLVRVLTPSGREMRPQLGVVGVETARGGVVDTRGIDARKQMETAADVAAQAAARAAADAAARAIRDQMNPQYQQQAPAPVAAPVVEAAEAAPAPKRSSKKAKAE